MSASVSPPGDSHRVNALRDRLTACFATVFPGLPQEAIPNARQTSLAAWDSIAALMLLNVIDEEFQVHIDLEVLPELDSFERVLAHLASRGDIPVVF